MQQKQKIVFFGDSITAAGVSPTGYITVLSNLIAQKGLKDQYELIGAGIGGNKVYDLYLRMEDDVLAKNPTTVVIWIGVNDVWHKKGGTGTDAPKFEQFYNAIIKKLQAKNDSLAMIILKDQQRVAKDQEKVTKQLQDKNAIAEKRRQDSLLRMIKEHEQKIMRENTKRFKQDSIKRSKGIKPKPQNKKVV